MKVRDETRYWLITGFAAAAFVAFVVLDFFVHGYWLKAAIKVASFLGFPILYFCFFSKKHDLRALFAAEKKAPLWWSGVLGLVTFLLIICGFLIFQGSFDAARILETLTADNITRSTYPFVFLYIVLFNAFLEELFFRGFVFIGLYSLGHKKTAFVFSAVLFSLYHIPIILGGVGFGMLVVALVGLGAAGVLFNEAARRCQNIWGALIIHVCANLAINLIAAYFFYL